jgi:hypothetical protein
MLGDQEWHDRIDQVVKRAADFSDTMPPRDPNDDDDDDDDADDEDGDADLEPAVVREPDE